MICWIRLFLIALAAAAVMGYACDWVVYSLHGSPSDTVCVNRFLSAPLKNNKQELDYLGSENVRCSRSLFPHQNQTPCWYLKRHINETTTI